ncbi:MAG: iron chelate uptake ABC transporter family permease subunit, partial [Cyanobacteria bacterium J06648_11]
MTLSRLGLFSLAALLCASVLLSLAVGSVRIPLADTVRILLGVNPPQAQASWHDIIWQFRLPKALASTTAGAALAVSGLLIQTLFRNPLAGPSILGINAGAGLGVALAVLSGGIAEVANLPKVAMLGDLGVALAASLGAIAATLVVLAVARQVRDSMALLIFGVMFGYATTALVTTLLHFSVVEQTQA